MSVYKSKKPTKDGRQYFFRIKYRDILGISHDYSSPKFKSPREAKDAEAIYRIKVANQEAFTSTITFGQAYKEMDYQKRKNIKKGTIRINKTLTTKIKGEKYTISSPKTKNSIRSLPMPKKLLDDLAEIKNNVQKFKDYKEEWFVFGNVYPFPESTIQAKKNMYCDKANLRRIRVHDFRHSCASLLINRGASIALVSKYLGHSNISITLNTYTHLYKSELDNISEILNNL